MDLNYFKLTCEILYLINVLYYNVIIAVFVYYDIYKWIHYSLSTVEHTYTNNTDNLRVGMLIFIMYIIICKICLHFV